MEPIQFGEHIDNPIVLTSAYAVILNEQKQVLFVEVKGKYLLPGGRIEPNEAVEDTVRREVLEETGYTVYDLRYIGQANQFLPKASLGPMNKVGTFFMGRAGKQDMGRRVEKDHTPVWLDVDTYMTKRTWEFHQWAVKIAFGV